MTKDPSQKERILSLIAIFVGNIIMMNIRVSRRWQLRSNNEEAPHQPRFVFRIYLSAWTCTLCFWLLLYCIFFFYFKWMTHWFWIILSYMNKDQAIFSTVHECNTKQIIVCDDRSLSVVGSGIVLVENGHFNDVYYVFQKFPAICN